MAHNRIMLFVPKLEPELKSAPLRIAPKRTDLKFLLVARSGARAERSVAPRFASKRSGSAPERSVFFAKSQLWL